MAFTFHNTGILHAVVQKPLFKNELICQIIQNGLEKVIKLEVYILEYINDICRGK